MPLLNEQQMALTNVKAAGVDELASHFLALEKTVQNMASQLNNVERENGIFRNENAALRVTVEELEVQVIDLQARLEYVEAVTRKDGKPINFIF